MKKKIHKILGVTLAVVLMVSLMVAAAPVSAKTYDLDEWEKYEIPEADKEGDFVLYPDSDVGPIAIASDGTLYATTPNTTTDADLFKSTDDGHRWESLWDAEDNRPVVDIVISPVDDEVIFVATDETVYKSTDGGDSFDAKSTTAYAGEDILALDVTYFNDEYIIVIGTEEDVYTFDESSTFGDWEDRMIGDDADDWFETTYGATDVKILDVRFSPNFEDDRQIVAVVWYTGAKTGVIISTMLGGGSWGGTVSDTDFDRSTPAIDPIDIPLADTASLVFPADYDSDPDEGDYAQFVGIGDSANLSVDVGVYLIYGVEFGEGPSPAIAMATAESLGLDPPNILCIFFFIDL